ncbi:hypothetical protein D3C72_1684390 [compost metagenome]
MQDEVGAVLQLQRRGLQLGAQLGMGAGRAVADGDDIAGPDEDVGLAVPDGVVGLLRRAGDDEELAAIDLDLGHLMRRQRVLDRQGVQMKAPHQGLELLARRLVQTDPQVFAGLKPQPLVRQRRLANPLAVLVDIGGDDAHGHSFIRTAKAYATPTEIEKARRISPPGPLQLYSLAGLK